MSSTGSISGAAERSSGTDGRKLTGKTTCSTRTGSCRPAGLRTGCTTWDLTGPCVPAGAISSRRSRKTGTAITRNRRRRTGCTGTTLEATGRNIPRHPATAAGSTGRIRLTEIISASTITAGCRSDGSIWKATRKAPPRIPLKAGGISQKAA